MSRFAAISELNAVVGEVRRQQVVDVVRGATFIGAFLLAWISLHPFEDLSNMQIGDVTTGNEVPTYAMFGGVAVLAVMLAARDNMRGLATLLTPAFVLFVGWMCVTILSSRDTGTVPAATAAFSGAP